MTSCIVGQFLTPPPPIVTPFITKALALSSQNPGPSPPKTVTSLWMTHYLKEHEGTHDDPGAGRDGDVEEHVFPDRVVLAVAPGQGHHRHAN